MKSGRYVTVLKGLDRIWAVRMRASDGRTICKSVFDSKREANAERKRLQKLISEAE